MGRILLLFTLLLWVTAKAPVEGHPLPYSGNNTSAHTFTSPCQEKQNTIIQTQNIDWQLFISEIQPTSSQYGAGTAGRNYKNGLQYKHLYSRSKAPYWFHLPHYPEQYISACRYANGGYLYFLKKIVI